MACGIVLRNKRPNQTRDQIIRKFVNRISIGFFIVPIRLYQYLISPLIGPKCRFTPSCSHYAEEALKTHGALKGLTYASLRLAKCHPWHTGGYDPVPTKSESNKTTA